jgi:hypothetical protein
MPVLPWLRLGALPAAQWVVLPPLVMGLASSYRLHLSAEDDTGCQTQRDDHQLHPRLPGDQDHARRDCGDGGAGRVGTELAAHAEHRLSDNDQRNELEAVYGCVTGRAGDRRQERGEGEHEYGRRQSKAEKSGKPAGPPGMHQTQAESKLTARGPREELAQRKQTGELGLAEPRPLVDELPTKVAQVGDRAAE